MVSGTFKKKFRILESSDMWSQKCLKTEVCGDSVSQRVSGDKIVLAADNRIDRSPTHCCSDFIFSHPSSCLLCSRWIGLLAVLWVTQQTAVHSLMLTLLAGGKSLSKDRNPHGSHLDAFMTALKCRLIRKDALTTLWSTATSILLIGNVFLHIICHHLTFYLFLISLSISPTSSYEHNILFTTEFLAPRTVPVVHLLRKRSINRYSMDYLVVTFFNMDWIGSK